MHLKSLTLTTLVCFTVAACQAADWPAFRGPLGDGTSDEKKAPTSWDAKHNVQWKAPLSQPGNGSPIVSDGSVFLACAEDKDGLHRSLYCFDRRDGRRKWVRTVAYGKKMPTHKTSPYCGSTPVADGQRVVVWHGSAGLFCYDFDGTELWSRDLGEYRHMWGYGTSPVLFKDRVVMHCGPGARVSIACLDLNTGKTLWETEEPVEGSDRRKDGKYMGSWTTPLIVNRNGQPQIICTMPTRVIGLDPTDGSTIWTCDGIRGPKGDLAYSSPILAGGTCVAIGGFNGPGIGVQLGGTGNVTDTHRVWRRESNPQSIGSGVFVDGFIYRPNAGPGTIECLDPQTGKTVWSDRAGGSNHWASIVYVAGRCYATNQRGTTVVFRPDPERFQHVSTNPLGEPSNATPAFSDGEFFIRTDHHLVCISE
jgi:outer membrane protein assembly factor BamB